MSTLLVKLGARDPEHLLLLGDAGVTYGEIEDGARRVAALLTGGARSLAGKRVGVFASPGRAFLHGFFGVLHAGGCAVVLSPLHPAAESRYFCDDADIQAILISPDLARRAKEIAGDRPLYDLTNLARVTRRIGPPTPRPEDDALMLYTSGTTSKPKGAVLTHQNLITQAGLLERAWGFSPSDVLLHVLPLHHMHGLCIALMTAVASGASVRMLPQFDARHVWDSMADSTVLMAVPTIYAKLFSAFDAATDADRARWTNGARSLRLATSGSAALPVTLAERWRALTGSIPLERFGMTEIGVGLTNPLDPRGRKPGFVGFPLPTVEACIVDSELWIRGPSVFRGYHGKPDATRAAFAEGGWFKTGDTVEQDEAGSYRILGRTSVDILKTGGYKVSALEIEEALREHAAVAEVAVVGIQDEVWGDRVVACVVKRADVTAEDLRELAKKTLAPYKCPKDVVFMDDLPKNAMGKVVKSELAARLRATTER